MATDPAVGQPRETGSRSWFRRSDLLLVAGLIGGFVFPEVLGKSDFAMACFVAAVFCVSLAITAILRRYLEDWAPSVVWRLRIAALAVGIWLSLAAPRALDRILAIALYVVAYAACEWAIHRRVREHRRTHAA